MVLGKLDSYTQQNETQPLFHTIHKSQDFNIRPDTIAILQQNMGYIVLNINLSDVFFESHSQARKPKATADDTTLN